MTERITRKQALRAARARLPILGDKALQGQLDFAIGCCSRCSEARALAEAFRMGAETAQRLIVEKIDAIGAKKTEPTS
jgi:hypothetical protein